MKKIFYLASIAALALSSCAKDDTTDVVLNPVNKGGMTISASRSIDTRSFLDRNENGALVPVWSTGDAFSAYGDGENSVGNVMFALDPTDHGQERGTFQSKENNHLLLAGENVVFLYPFNSLYKMTPAWDAHGVFQPSTVTGMEIKAEQQYQVGTFAAAAAPAIGFLDLESIDESAVDGAAEAYDVNMEALADYVAVNIQGTEPIESVTLRLKAGNQKYYQINGEAQLLSYTMNEDLTNDPEVGTHYYLGFPAKAADGTTNGTTSADAAITPNITTGYATAINQNVIKVGRQDAVACHEPNTYVFAVPGGILGLDKGVTAEILVNYKQGQTVKEGFNYFTYNGPALNGGEGWMREWAVEGSVAVADDDALNKMTNGVFWLNPLVDTDGDEVADTRSSFMYNPNNDFIIRNELDWLIYFNEYADDTYKDVVGSAYQRDAYVCGPNEHTPGVVTFNFDPDHIDDIAAELVKLEAGSFGIDDKDYAGNKDRYTGYVDDYRDNGMPCIDNYSLKEVGWEITRSNKVVYKHEFLGHGAELINVHPLQSRNGLFGKLAESDNRPAMIDDIIFTNLEGITYTVEDEDGNEVEEKGVILSSYTNGAVLSDITVDGAKAEAVIGEANQVAHYEALTLENVSGLNAIISKMTLDEDLDVANWETVYDVQEDVFTYLDAAAHYIVTIEDLVGTYTEDYDKLAGDIAVYRKRDTTKAVSVILKDRSMWTGSAIASVAESDEDGNTPIATAEEFAYGNDNIALLTIDIDANYANHEISWPNEVPFAEGLDGGDYTIYGLTLNTVCAPVKKSTDRVVIDHKTSTIATDKKDALAPFKSNSIENLNIEGLYISVETSNLSSDLQRVPKYIAGLTKTAEEITNVSINDMKVNATEITETLNGDAYYDGVVPYIGWAVSVAEDIQMVGVSANVTEYDVLGLAGLVSNITVTNNDSFFEDCAVTAPASLPAIEEFDAFDADKKNYKLAGSMVALVVNPDNHTRGIKFNESGNPIFLYDFTNKTINNASINVYYNDDLKWTIKSDGTIVDKAGL